MGLNVHEGSSIWMTGDPQVGHGRCVAYPRNPVLFPPDCEGVMIEVHFGSQAEIRICRHHLDVVADMIVHTRKLRPADPDYDPGYDKLLLDGMPAVLPRD